MILVWLSGFACSFIADWAGVDVVQTGHGDAMLPEWYQQASKWVMGAIFIGRVADFANPSAIVLANLQFLIFALGAPPRTFSEINCNRRPSAPWSIDV